MKRLNWCPSIPSKALAYYMFKEMVQDRAVWDFKVVMKKDLGTPIRIGGQWFEYSTAGNILYGFTGTAAGFTPIELDLGAGYAQLRDHFSKGDEIGTLATAFDTRDDYYAVQFGVELYYNTLGQGRPLTVREFSALLVKYDHLHDMAVRDPPKGVKQPAAEGWPYQAGRFNGPNRPRPSWLFPSFQ